MSNEQDPIEPIVAGIGFNDGANKGFWRKQPRDFKKRWVEMGAEVRAALKKLREDGTTEQISKVGRVVGSTGTEDQARVLFEPDEDFPDGAIAAINSDSLEAIKAELSDEYLKSQGIDPNADKFGNPVGGLVPQDIATTDARITQGDRDLASGGVATPEGQEMSQYKDSPEGKARDAADAAGGGKKAKPATTPAAEKDAADTAIEDAWNDAVNGKAPDLDTVINAAKAPPSKKLIDLNPGDKVVSDSGEVLEVVNYKLNPDTTAVVNFRKSDGTAVSKAVPKNQSFPMAPKAAKSAPAAPSAPSAPKVRPATRIQIDQLDNFKDQVDGDSSIDPALKQQFDDLMTKLDNAEDVSSDEAKAVLDGIKAHFKKPVTAPKTPTPKAPKIKPIPEISKKSAAEIALAKKRMDDGSDVALDTNGMTEDDLRDLVLDAPLLDENGKPMRDPNNPKKIIQDPNAIINSLLERFPNAKVNGDNDRIILERSDWTDPVTGKKYKFEMSVSRTYGNQFMQHYKFTDEATGEVKDFQLADYKDSFAGIFSKSNGILKLRDQLLGNSRPGKKLTRELQNYFGPNKGLDQRLKYYRKGSDMFGWSLLTPEENIKKFLEGTDRKFNLSMAQTGTSPDGEARFQFGNVLRGQVSSFWDAVASNDSAMMKWRLVQLLGRMSDNADSRKLLIDTLRDEIKKRFNGQPNGRNMATLANNLDKYLASNLVDLRDINRTPFVYGDGSEVAQLGDKVIYFPNEKQYSVGRIVAFNPGTGKNGQYHDTVRVQFGDGTTVDLLQTRNMFKAGPDSEYGDPELTDYTANVKLDEKLELRKALLGPAYDEFLKKRAGRSNPETLPDPDSANPNPGQPYLGSDGKPANSSGAPVSDGQTADPQIVDNAPATPAGPVEGNVVRMQPNDSWYGENGDYLGVVVETQELPATDGGEPGLAVFYIDENGNELVEVVEKSDNRGPK